MPIRLFLRLTFLSFAFTALLSGCGGGGAESEPSSAALSVQESQRYFPLSVGNVWVSKVTRLQNGLEVATYTTVDQQVGTKLVANVTASVVSHTTLPLNSSSESYLVKDDNGVSFYGNNDATDTITAAIAPYRLIQFPVQVGSTQNQINKSGVDYGRDVDGDGRDEKIDISITMVATGIESVTTAAGTFSNCLRIDIRVTETLTASSNGASVTASGVETTWYAQDIGPVKQVSTISGRGQTAEEHMEVTGYLVDGQARGLSLQLNATEASIPGGSTSQLSVSLADASGSALIEVPAAWATDNSVVASVDATGTVTGKKAGVAHVTPWVGGVSGPSVTVNVLLGFKPGIGYAGPGARIALSNTAMGDLNGDGRNDMAVVGEYGSRIFVYTQNSSGTFNQPYGINTDLTLQGIAIADVTNDGLADLVVSGSLKTASSGRLGRVAVYKQNSTTHALDGLQEWVLSTDNAGFLAVADLNGDGLPDVVVASPGTGGNGVISFLFQHGGSLGAEVTYTAVPVRWDAEVHVADLDRDGRNDVVVQSGSKQLAVIRQVAPGSFSGTPDFYTVQTSYWPSIRSFAVGDLNGDGRADIAVADPGNEGYLSVFLNAQGGLGGPIVINAGYATQDELKIADLNVDGLNDLVVLTGGNKVEVFLQSQSHTFDGWQTFNLPTSSYGGTSVHQAMSIGDVTGDGLPDVVASWSDDGIFVLPSL